MEPFHFRFRLEGSGAASSRSRRDEGRTDRAFLFLFYLQALGLALRWVCTISASSRERNESVVSLLLAEEVVWLPLGVLASSDVPERYVSSGAVLFSAGDDSEAS